MTKSVNNVKVSLSRLALAKALKTPDESEQHQQQRQLEDSWENSIIFYQSHIPRAMFQQLIDGDRGVRREHILRHFGSKITLQEHWQHPENKNNKVPSTIHPSVTLTESVTATGTNTIGGTSNYSGNNNNYFLKSTSSSSTSEESVPTTPTTPKPVSTVRKQRYVRHPPSGTSYQGVCSNGSVISSRTNISKNSSNNDNNGNVENKEKIHYEARRNDIISINEKNKQRDNKRDLRINRQTHSRPASPMSLDQQMQFVSLGENQRELLHKPGHKGLVGARHEQANKHYYPCQQQDRYHHYSQQVRAASKQELIVPAQKYYYQLSQLQQEQQQAQYPSQMDTMSVSSLRSYGSFNNSYRRIRKSSSYNSLGSVSAHNPHQQRPLRQQHGRSPLSVANTEEKNTDDRTYFYNQAKSDARRRAEIRVIESRAEPYKPYSSLSSFNNNNNYNTMPYSIPPPALYVSSTPTLSPSHSMSNLSYYNSYGNNAIVTPTTPWNNPMMVYPNAYAHQPSM